MASRIERQLPRLLVSRKAPSRRIQADRQESNVPHKGTLSYEEFLEKNKNFICSD